MPSKVWSGVSGITCTPSSYCGKLPVAMRACRSRRWKSGSMPPSFWLSCHTRLWMPATGFQCHFTSDVSPLAVRQPERVHAEALHRGVAARDGAVRHHPHQHVRRLGLQADEVPERVVRALRLRDLAVGLGLHRVDEVGELQPVLDEEHRDVVADEIEVALVRIELRREAAHVARGVGRAARTGDGREARERRRDRALAQERGGADVARARRSPRTRRGRRRRGRARRARGCARGRSG